MTSDGAHRARKWNVAAAIRRAILYAPAWSRLHIEGVRRRPPRALRAEAFTLLYRIADPPRVGDVYGSFTGERKGVSPCDGVTAGWLLLQPICTTRMVIIRSHGDTDRCAHLLPRMYVLCSTYTPT